MTEYTNWLTFFLLLNALVNIDILSLTVGSLKHSLVKASLASDSSAFSVFIRLQYKLIYKEQQSKTIYITSPLFVHLLLYQKLSTHNGQPHHYDYV